MITVRRLPAALATLALVAACDGPSKKDLQADLALRSDSLFYVQNQLLEQVMEGARFVNEINKELAKARGINLGSARQLQTSAELADANDERRQVVARVTRLVERLDAVQGRLAGMRKEVADKDSTLKSRIAEYEHTLAEAFQSADRQRAELQMVIDSQTVRIAELTGQVDTLSGQLGQLTTDHNAVYVVVGTRQELIDKGVIVPEGGKRFLLVGSRSVAPARDLDPAVFTRLDRRTDRTIVLPDGEYRIISRHSPAHATAELTRKGALVGALSIDQPERFWNGSRFLILMKS
jgi:hypothetical protein